MNAPATIYNVHTAKGSHAGTLREVCAWQAEHQGSAATMVKNTPVTTGPEFEIHTVEIDVSGVDFDADDLSECMFDVKALFAAELATR